jgi:predicted outer membrane repeat protein
VEGLTLTNGDNLRGGGVAIDMGAQVEMVGVHVTGNTADWSGGGIDLRDGGNPYLHLADSVISDNAVSYGIGAVGGGMRILEDATAELMNVVIRDNESSQDGGGIWTSAGLSAHGLTLAGNTAEDKGGGLYATGGLVHITHLEATDNSSGNSGGGLYLNDSAGLNLEDSTLTGNEAGTGGGIAGGGGAIFAMNYSNIYAINSRFVENTSLTQGGAIDLTAGSSAQLEAAVFAANTTGGDGGGIHLGTSTGLTLSHVSVVGNHASGSGGGVAVGVLGAAPVLNAVILADNTADDSGGALAALGTDMMLSYSCLWGNTPEHVTGMSDPLGQFGNVEADPEFLDVVDPDPTLWDLHLGATSALIDEGPLDIQDPDTSQSDMGAYSGPRAGSWDRDDDGDDEWWQPGEYDTSTYPGAGWDCDDTDPLINADNGCS